MVFLSGPFNFNVILFTSRQHFQAVLVSSQIFLSVFKFKLETTVTCNSNKFATFVIFATFATVCGHLRPF